MHSAFAMRFAPIRASSSYGEDVGGKYGNAFLLLRPLLAEFGDRILNSILAEGGVLGVCIGAALAGQRPIGEMQFNDFVASGFNQLVNNAAKIRYRWGGSVPMVVRMPWGGLRHAGPYHSQNTEAVVLPHARNQDRGALDAVRRARADGQLRWPIRIPCSTTSTSPSTAIRESSRSLASDARRRADRQSRVAPCRRRLAIISYGAYVHVGACESPTCWRSTASRRACWTCARSRRSIATRSSPSPRHCSRVLIVHEDTRTGGIGESVAAIIQEEAFESLDAPVRILGALDTPVPYSPPLEDSSCRARRKSSEPRDCW